MRTEQLTLCFEPLQELRARLDPENRLQPLPQVIYYSAFTGYGFCQVPSHVIFTCKLHISSKI